NIRATSSTLGGKNGVTSGGTAVSAAAPCLNRQVGQSPARTPEGSGAPHCGHFCSMFRFVWSSFIHPPTKRIPELVTRMMNYLPAGHYLRNGLKQKQGITSVLCGYFTIGLP